jgi:GGDEF domain-containing protein
VLFEVPGSGSGTSSTSRRAASRLSLRAREASSAARIAAALYALAIIVAPHVPTRDVLTYATRHPLRHLHIVRRARRLVRERAPRHLEQLRDLAERDFLTGILNTRVFDEALLAALRRGGTVRPAARRHGQPQGRQRHARAHRGNSRAAPARGRLGAVHPTGDELARVGGDEFAVLTDASAGERRALSARSGLASLRRTCTMTFGWAALDTTASHRSSSFRKADDRLYAAKLVARNHRVVRQAVGAQQ